MAKAAKPRPTVAPLPERDAPPYMAAACQVRAEITARFNATSTSESFREHLARQVRMLWFSIDGNDADSMFPFTFSAHDFERLREVLCDAHVILTTAAVIPLKERAASLDRARHDDAFQSMLKAILPPTRKAVPRG